MASVLTKLLVTEHTLSKKGVNPFVVKFEKEPTLPPFLSEVRLDNLEAIEIRSNVYSVQQG